MRLPVALAAAAVAAALVLPVSAQAGGLDRMDRHMRDWSRWCSMDWFRRDAEPKPAVKVKKAKAKGKMVKKA